MRIYYFLNFELCHKMDKIYAYLFIAKKLRVDEKHSSGPLGYHCVLSGPIKYRISWIFNIIPLLDRMNFVGREKACWYKNNFWIQRETFVEHDTEAASCLINSRVNNSMPKTLCQ